MFNTVLCVWVFLFLFLPVMQEVIRVRKQMGSFWNALPDLWLGLVSVSELCKSSGLMRTEGTGGDILRREGDLPVWWTQPVLLSVRPGNSYCKTLFSLDMRRKSLVYRKKLSFYNQLTIVSSHYHKMQIFFWKRKESGSCAVEISAGLSIHSPANIV